MTVIDFLLIAAVAVVCGTFGYLTGSYVRGGWFINVGAGLFGALAGVVIANSLPLPAVYVLKIKGVSFPLLWAVVGSAVFIAAAGLFIKPGR